MGSRDWAVRTWPGSSGAGDATEAPSPASLCSPPGQQARRRDAAEPRKTTFPLGTAPGAPLAPPPPRGSESSTSGSGNNPAPAALAQPRWALFRSPTFAPFFLETQLRSWRCPAGISRPRRVSPGASAAPELGRACLRGGWEFPRARRAGARRGAGYRAVAPALTFLVSSPCPVAASQTRVCVSPWRTRPRTAPRGRAQW